MKGARLGLLGRAAGRSGDTVLEDIEAYMIGVKDLPMRRSRLLP